MLFLNLLARLDLFLLVTFRHGVPTCKISGGVEIRGDTLLIAARNTVSFRSLSSETDFDCQSTTDLDFLFHLVSQLGRENIQGHQVHPK